MSKLTLCLRVRVMKISCLMPSSLPHGSHDVKVLAFVLCSKKNCSICKAADRFTRLLIVLNKVQAPVRLLVLIVAAPSFSMLLEFPKD